MLFNRTQNKVIHPKIQVAKTFLQKFRGLMGEKKENFDYCLVFELEGEGKLRASMHMLFMQFPTDMIFLNSKKQVVDLMESLQPWTINHTPKNPAKFVVEMEAGSIQKNGIKMGDELAWD